MTLTRYGVVSPILLIFISHIFISHVFSSPSIIELRTSRGNVLTTNGDSRRVRGVDLYCESWRFTVETNDAGSWSRIPENCVDFVKDYINGQIYSSESEAVADNAAAYAKSVNLSGNGKDAWVFDIDETLLSNVPYYADHGFGSEIFDDVSFDNWVDLADAPALPASLRLYKELQKLGFTIILLTGRDESQRNVTGTNLQYAGYTNYERLFLRGDNDHGKLATVYKSEKRQELVDEGFIIHGNSGDQWSDLTGFAVAKRSFKLPNPLYFIA